jgi:hypothetical protein
MAEALTAIRDGQTGQAVKGCWAASLGDCDGKISREHLVSQALFPDGGVRVRGFHWCKDESKNVGLGAMTGKILCQKHNNDLSELDSAAKQTFDTFNDAWTLHESRQKVITRSWSQKTFTVDGVLLERWFLKTLINIGHGGEWIIGAGTHSPGMPSDELVQIVFGRASFLQKSGLYIASNNGPTEVVVMPGLSLTPKTIGRNLMAGMFDFCGMRFLLSLVHEELKQERGERLSHHVAHLQYATHDDKRRSVKSHRIDIMWS